MNTFFHSIFLVLLTTVVNQIAAEKDVPTQNGVPVIRTIEGWTVKVDPTVFKPEHSSKGQRALQALGNHLQRVTYLLPDDVLNELREIPIWVDRDGKGKSLVYHPSADWLADNGYNPAMAKHVHVPKIDLLLSRQQWAKHPYAIMHELAHAYHDQVLGWDDAEIKALYELAENSGSYDHVLDHAHRQVRHYGMNNHKEYFAESTEAYLGVNDFYPFVRAELKQHDPRMFDLQSKIWGPLP
ncbi:metallopeptidase [Stieleria sp. TO1_6]|uniref:metallopeptidase n=1 Tax=Stieleria tagensis TaxID=2956795 RepID=UPI00209A86F3|nr:metallopeptidase [Stieleria tagensis]MCO8121283.1 metallopeptidase [Stieleria tagensis]